MTEIISQNAELANAVLSAARERGWCLATAESCTAGLIAAALSSAEGAASCLHGGIIAYTKDMKIALLGVSPVLLAERTAVCAEVAQAMASGAVARTPADAAIAITGVAGPEPDEDGNPVGLVYVAVATPDNTAVRRFDFQGEREEILRLGLEAAMTLFVEQADAAGGTGRAA
jgi:nicotinamide-nucleotide amidase